MKHYTMIGLVSISLAACATSNTPDAEPSPQPTSRPSKRDSARAVSAAASGLSAAQADAVANHASLRSPAVESLDFTGACELGGSFDISGTYDYSIGGDTDFDLTTSFVGCALPEGSLDGDLRWRQSVTLDGEITETITGQIDWQDATTSASCTFNLTIIAGAAGIRYEGSVCGYDVATELSAELAAADLPL